LDSAAGFCQHPRNQPVEALAAGFAEGARFGVSAQHIQDLKRFGGRVMADLRQDPGRLGRSDALLPNGAQSVFELPVQAVGIRAFEQELKMTVDGLAVPLQHGCELSRVLKPQAGRQSVLAE
jgi:hypothetical protein